MTSGGSRSPVVIGAGVAGLAAAVELADAGLRPHLLEARPYVGGRSRSLVHAGSGDEIDNGQHLMMGCYHQTFRLLDRIGTRHLVCLQDRLHVEFRDADGTRATLRAVRALPAPLDVLAGMLRLGGLSIGERLGLVRVARAAMRDAGRDAGGRNDGRDAGREAGRDAGDRDAGRDAGGREAGRNDGRDAGREAGRDAGGRNDGREAGGRDETVERLLVRLRQSERTRRRLWDPIVIATMNTPPAEASAALFLEIMRRAFLGGPIESRLAIPRVGLSRLFEPAVQYVVDRGGRVSLGTSVAGIESGIDSGSSAFVVRTRDGAAIESDDVIVALPPNAASALLAADGVDPAIVSGAPLELSPIVSVYLWYDRSLDTIGELTALLGTHVQWVFNRRRMMRADAMANAAPSAFTPGLLACTTSAADAQANLTRDAIIELVDGELHRAFSELDGARLVDAIVIKERHATFRAIPGIETLRPRARTRVRGLYLAGDWTDTGLPATIEGAAQSGFAAAAALLENRIGREADIGW